MWFSCPCPVCSRRLSPAMQHGCDAVKLGQSCGRRRPLHALPIVRHHPHARETALHLPEVGLDLVALVASHDGVDGAHPTAAQASESASPNLMGEGIKKFTDGNVLLPLDQTAESRSGRRLGRLVTDFNVTDLDLINFSNYCCRKLEFKVAEAPIHETD